MLNWFEPEISSALSTLQSLDVIFLSASQASSIDYVQTQMLRPIFASWVFLNWELMMMFTYISDDD